MKRTAAYAILIIFCFILQATLFSHLAFAGIVPNLLVIATASLGFMRGERAGAYCGFFCGLLLDIFFGDVIGFNAMVYLYIGFLNGKFSGRFYPENIRLPLILISASDALYGLAAYLLMFLLRGRFDFSYYFANIIIPEMVYTIVLALGLYPLILWLDHLLEGRGKGHGGMGTVGGS